MAERTISGIMTVIDAEGRTIATGEGTVRIGEVPQVSDLGPFLATQTRMLAAKDVTLQVDLKTLLGDPSAEPLVWGPWQFSAVAPFTVKK